MNADMEARNTTHTPHLAWHLHHDVLIEMCSGCEERRAYIREDKPETEQPLRLRLFQSVIGPLSAELDKARAEWDKALAEWNNTRVELRKANAELGNARAEWNKASAEWNKARAELRKANAEWDTALKASRGEIEALHALECPGCPWNGKTIFSERK